MRKSSIIFSFFTLVILLCFNLTVNAEENPSVGQTYRSWVNNPPINYNFGEAEIVDYGIGTEKKVLIKDSWLFWNKKYASIPETMYIVYKFPVRINVRIEKLSSDYIYVPAGVSKTSSYTRQAEHSYIYEESASVELETKSKYSSELSGGLSIPGATFGAKVSSSVEISQKISKTITKTTSYKYLTEITENFTISSDSSSYYSYERRGLFDIYVCQIYQNNYNIKKLDGNQTNPEDNNRIVYSEKDFTLIEQNVKLTYVDDTKESGYYKYDKNNNGEFYYNDNKIPGILYY